MQACRLINLGAFEPPQSSLIDRSAGDRMRYGQPRVWSSGIGYWDNR